MRNPLWHPPTTLNCRGKLIQLDEPKVMGILNITPDSFYPGSRINDLQQAVDRGGSLIAEGADILDIGGYSSRPGAVDISPEEEGDRILPVITALHQAFPDIPLSIDTFRSQVAEQAIAAGAGMINDVSGGDLDPMMWEIVAKHQIPYILMHMQGTPATMQQQPHYEDVVTDVLDVFIKKVGQLRELGVHDVILDPGFGFGKTQTHNYELLRGLGCFRILGLPLMVGISRKSMIWKPLGGSSETALNGTSSLHMIALEQGANLLRVHDPAPAKEVIVLWKCLSPKVEE